MVTLFLAPLAANTLLCSLGCVGRSLHTSQDCSIVSDVGMHATCKGKQLLGSGHSTWRNFAVVSNRVNAAAYFSTPK